MGFFDFSDDDEKYDVIVREPSLSGKFANVGVPERETAQRIYASPDTQKQLNDV